MAEFNADIQLRLRTEELDRKLRQIEQKIGKIGANPGGGALIDQYNKVNQKLNEATALVKKRGLAEQTNTRELRKQQTILKARNKAAQSALSGAAISAAFPLLTGGSPAESLLGGVGGGLGALFGPTGSFAGGIAGSAIGRLLTDAENLNKELAGLNARLDATGSAAAITAGDISDLASQLNIAKEDAANLAAELVAVVDATALQDVAQAFGPVGGASTFEAIAQAGLDEKSALEAIDSLRGQIGLKAAEQLTKVLETQGAVALQAALLDEVLRKSQDVTTETAKQVTIWDRINFLVQEYLLGIASASSPQGLADQRAEGIEPPEIGVLDGALTKYEDYLKKRNALNERYKPKRGGGGRSGANEEERIQQRLASLQAETAAVQRRAEIESKISQARIAEDQSLVNRLTLERELSTIREREEKALARVTDLRLKEAISTKASAEAAAARSRYTDKEAERLAKAEQSYTKQIETLNLQLQAAEAVTREEQKQAELQLRLLQLRNANKDLTEEQLQSLEAATRKLFEATNLSPLDQYIKNTSAALADTEQQMANIVQTVEGQLASGISNFFTGIIDGSKSAEEAFADMLKGMGQALVQTAAQMIAQYIAIGIARAFAGMGGGDSFGSGASAPLTSGLDFSSAFRADGGPVNANRPYMVGERGPELFVPSSPGTVVTNEQSRAQLDMYSPGNAVDAPAGPMNVNMNYSGPTMAFDDKRYVPVEAIPGIIKDAAKQGEQRTLASMRNRVSTRNRVGI